MRDTEILFLVIAFAAAHGLAPLAWKYRQRAQDAASSFAGGLAMAYVFLHLIPEIDAGSHLLGARIYILIMVGFSAYYGLEILVHRNVQRDEARQGDHALNVALVGLYNVLLVYTLAQQLPSTSVLTLAFAVMIGLHLLIVDFGLLELCLDDFRRRGRFVLMASVLLGWGLTFTGEPDDLLVDGLTALLAGSMMYKVFRNELPEFQHVRFRAFLSGLGMFLLVHVALTAAD
jgi:zinc transporter ZupT